MAVALAGCSDLQQSSAEPAIEFTKVPDAGLGRPGHTSEIEGRAIGARQGQRIVLFAKTNVWYVQPLSTSPFTSVDSDSRWKSKTHFGTEYAALLVNAGFSPPTQTSVLPAKGGGVVAVARVKGRGHEAVAASVTPRPLRFSGFDWEARSEPSDRGGKASQYEASNAWVDSKGRLHLRIRKGPWGWTNAEVRLKDSLGYGTYSFVVEDTRHLEPAAVMGMYMYDATAPRQNFREMDIELSQWGEPLNRNAQYAVQPYYVPANVVRFSTPPGKLIHSLRWAPGQADFRTTQGEGPGSIADQSFTSGVPSPGEESVFIALYAYMLARVPLTKETEVVVERFEYKP